MPPGVIMMLAWRNLWRNHRRTIIMLAAVSIGAWAMIFMTALMRGMVNDMVRDGIRRHCPATSRFITPTTGTIPASATW